MIPRARASYSAIIDRPKLKLPGGNRIVIWSIVNLEVWDITRPMPRAFLSPPNGLPLMPDVPNWSWHEYGMRVGVWRFFKLFKSLGIRPTVSINARVCEDYERVAREARDSGWEFMAHAYDQIPMHKLEDQRAMIARTMDVITKFTGTKPAGWLGPGLTQTLETPDLLAEAGVRYIGDWVHDDEPTRISTMHGPLVTLPYTVEQNDIPVMMIHQHQSSYWTTRLIDTFDQLYEESADTAKIMAIAVHPYISGMPHRIRHLRAAYDYINRFEGVVHWNGTQILDWFERQSEG
jgi:peptidoglycan/xylan/chitin deacetylase (PgdA/CDA1 family)